MTSIARRISRAADKKNGITRAPVPQPTIMLPCGGYKTLHPTKGWQKVSGKRFNMKGK
jgi:hypothetical protein